MFGIVEFDFITLLLYDLLIYHYKLLYDLACVKELGRSEYIELTFKKVVFAP